MGSVCAGGGNPRRSGSLSGKKMGFVVVGRSIGDCVCASGSFS